MDTIYVIEECKGLQSIDEEYWQVCGYHSEEAAQEHCRQLNEALKSCREDHDHWENSEKFEHLYRLFRPYCAGAEYRVIPMQVFAHLEEFLEQPR